MKLRFTVAGSRGNIVEFESMVKDLIEHIRQPNMRNNPMTAQRQQQKHHHHQHI